MIKSIQKLFFLLEKEDKKKLFNILIFSIVISLLEVMGIGIIMPFISLASDFQMIFSNSYYRIVYTFLNLSTPLSFVLFFGSLLVLFYLFRSLFSLYYFHKLALFSQKQYYLFANRLFSKYLKLPYAIFIEKNSTHMVKAIVNEAQNLSLFISNLLFLISESIVALFIYILLLVVNWKITLLISLFLLLNVLLLLKFISPKIKKAGKERDIYQKKFYELLGNIFGNFKILKLRNNQNENSYKFRKFTSEFSKVNTVHSTLSQVPRLYLEAIGFSLIAFIIIIIIFVTRSDISSFLGLITFFLLGLFRLIPSLNRILSSYNNMLFYAKAVDIIFDDLTLKEENFVSKKIDFKEYIKIEGVGFRYNVKNILNDVNLIIYKNDKIAFIGESGSGKSTLVDILMGLHPLEEGTLSIDNTILSEEIMFSWREKIGYIPQGIYLFDGSVAHNVAMTDNYDAQRVEKVLEQAKILSLLKEQHEGIKTNVGEGGTKLSGGQRQRIAIARALYSNPEILILDEATSALDERVEEEIMDEIYKLCKDKTLIIIAHRLSTIKECNRIMKLDRGKLYELKNN